MEKTDSTLVTAFAGLKLKSPIIAASGPPTESAAAMLACANAGAGAIVTKSIVDYARTAWPNIPRRVQRNQRGLWIQGSFASETLTLTEGRAMTEAVRQVTDVPIIASVGVLDPQSDAPVEAALQLVEVGASMVHFDLFYLPQPRCSDAAIAGLRALFGRARAALPVPFGPKLNIDIPAHRFALAFEPTLFDAVFLLDSIRVPPPLSPHGNPTIDAWSGGLECSLFGDWQKPITLQYTRVLADAGISQICAGGGLRSASDILEAIMLGAGCAQIATQLMIHGYDWIRRVNDQLAALLSEQGYSNIGSARNIALRSRDGSSPEHTTPVHAVIDESKCQPCGVCTKLAFCPFISEQPNSIPNIDDSCYGCGFCEQYCPHEGAIRMEPIS
ncbi:hypothetical protein NKH99_07970 [Mesorhizobium sp. M0854]|uniref:hypothetical protein n=1 Tax=Mesorhizobium sp. M0854 TaxID=2957013 RepID=UPI00333BAC9A